MKKNNDCDKCIYDNKCPSQNADTTEDCPAYYNVSGLHLRTEEPKKNPDRLMFLIPDEHPADKVMFRKQERKE